MKCLSTQFTSDRLLISHRTNNGVQLRKQKQPCQNES